MDKTTRNHYIIFRKRLWEFTHIKISRLWKVMITYVTKGHYIKAKWVWSILDNTLLQLGRRKLNYNGVYRSIMVSKLISHANSLLSATILILTEWPNSMFLWQTQKTVSCSALSLDCGGLSAIPQMGHQRCINRSEPTSTDVVVLHVFVRFFLILSKFTYRQTTRLMILRPVV